MASVKVCPACSREFSFESTHCPDDGVPLVVLKEGMTMRPENLIGQVVDGRYRIERLIGRGGMGFVFACRHVVVGKPAAMKVLRLGPNQSDGVLQRFVREAQTANAIRSRHIVEMSDFGQMEDGFFYVVMELLEGMSLTQAMREGRLSKTDYLRVFLQMADALHLVHGQGIVHRDLKPDNVFLVHENGDPLFVKLLDFGIAKVVHAQSAGLTETGVVLGTPYYMSPEQARGDRIDHRADIYSFGVIMYRAFTGKLPFIAESMVGVLTRHVMEPPEPPSHLADVDAFTEQVILRCLAKSPSARFQSMAEVAAELRAIAMQYGMGAVSPMNATPLLMQQAQLQEQAQKSAYPSSSYPVAPAAVAAPASLSLPPSALDFSSGLHARPSPSQSGGYAASLPPGQQLLPPSAFSPTPPPGSISVSRPSQSYPSGPYSAAMPPPGSVPLMGEPGTQRSVVTSHTGKFALVPKRSGVLSFGLPIAILLAGVVVAIAIVLSRGKGSEAPSAASTAASSAPSSLSASAPPTAAASSEPASTAADDSSSNSIAMTAPSDAPSANPAPNTPKSNTRSPVPGKATAKSTATTKPPPPKPDVRSPFE